MLREPSSDDHTDEYELIYSIDYKAYENIVHEYTKDCPTAEIMFHFNPQSSPSYWEGWLSDMDERSVVILKNPPKYYDNWTSYMEDAEKKFRRNERGYIIDDLITIVSAITEVFKYASQAH